MGHIFILGGARSGKTALAERLAIRLGTQPCYLATAEALDAEMRERVASHRRLRHGRFETIEEPLALAEAIERAAMRHDVILVDCITLWLSNLLGASRDVAAAVDGLVATLGGLADTTVILVSNEVGLGIVPDNALARSFRDLAGTTHQRLAESCEAVHVIFAGLPLTLKGTMASELAPPEGPHQA